MIKKPNKAELITASIAIGVLVSIAAPEYGTYIAKTKIASTLTTASEGGKTIFAYYIDKGTMPEQRDMDKRGTALNQLYLTLAHGKYTTGLFNKSEENEASFDLTLRNIGDTVNGNVIAFSYHDNGGQMKVTCTPKQYIPKKYLPKDCV